MRAPSKVTVISEGSANFEPCVITTKMYRGSKSKFDTALVPIYARIRRVLRLVACSVGIMLIVCERKPPRVRTDRRAPKCEK